MKKSPRKIFVASETSQNTTPKSKNRFTGSSGKFSARNIGSEADKADIPREHSEAGNKMNHTAYESKPILTQSGRKPAQQKQMNTFFSESDEENGPVDSQKKSISYSPR